MSQKVLPPSSPEHPRSDRPGTDRGDGERQERRERPVLWGLVALVGVGLAIGLFAALVATTAADVLGLDGGERTSAESGEEASMYLPTPTATGRNAGPGPLVSVGPRGPGRPSGAASDQGGTQPISLSAGQTRVSEMERIDLVGSYPGGEGAVLQVQRKEGGTWSDFPVSVSVSGGQFSTYVQTGRVGKAEFRVVDTDSDAASNTVTVQITG